MVVPVKRLLSCRRARALGAPLASALLLAGCWGWIPEEPALPGPAATGAPTPAASPAADGTASPAAPAPQAYSVVAGDTLFSIAWRFRLKVSDLAAWNRLGDGSLILVGQRLRLTPPPGQEGGSAAPATSAAAAAPAPARPSAASRPAAASGASAGNAAAGRSASGSASRSAPKASAAQGAPARSGWRWPAQGRVDAKSARARAGDYGVRIIGRRGQNVHAADGGTVMYAGDGLKAYGLLVIVQHSPEWLSAYGHNEKILVKEGQEVRAGQPIATMGVGPGNAAMLHFEIRRGGKPVEPIALLPTRN